MDDKAQRTRFYSKVLGTSMNLGQGEGRKADDVTPYIISLDIGTTTMRSHVYLKNGSIKGSSSKRIQIMYPEPRWAEMDPELLVQQAVDCIKESIRAANITASQVTCIGITNQRSTFLTWDRETGKPFHNFITWQDLRASDHVKSWNNSYKLRALNKGSSLLHMFTRQPRFLAASVLKFMSNQVGLRLIWALENIEELRHRASEDQVMFGCIDTWLLWKLTGEKVHATDYSNASGTGLFDPFQVEWSSIVCNLLHIPMSMLPEIRDTSGLFGKTDASLFGAAIPITAMISDQMSAMFGECCFDVGDMKCTMGTGTFVDVNTGSSAHASVAGLYPQIGWKIKDELVFVAEGAINDTGIVIEWAKSMGFFDDVADTSRIAESVPDSGQVCMVAAFSGLQAPINDDKAASSIFGLKPTTTKAHLVRALLESIAFRFKILYEAILKESKVELSNTIRADGGVCNNDFLMQLISDLTGQLIDRSKQRADITSLGAAFVAGLHAGVWKDKEELRSIRKSEQIFKPDTKRWSEYKEVFTDWERAVTRSKEWYSRDS
ncbi:putative glycerol kinase 5 [Mizuhopecten yessoensis]|uniref:putative glycerol kinase 5 n=1 Tax=Mizuhopecten yessoensis TaxID=6573 RepID=UPI000B45AB08|nr:putative glycerol kinase 5 [Mizuhopecten yessoensis]XP_021372119.1 putative glycerol kinase 5 [Mizuhopecten yessoensis]